MDLETFHEWSKQYTNDIYRVCMHLTRDEELSAKITIQVFVEYYMDLKSKKPSYDLEDRDKVLYDLARRSIKMLREMMKSQKNGKRGGRFRVDYKKD